jgi:hypothetical protein
LEKWKATAFILTTQVAFTIIRSRNKLNKEVIPMENNELLQEEELSNILTLTDENGVDADLSTSIASSMRVRNTWS